MKKIILFIALLSGSNGFGMANQYAETAIDTKRFPEYIHNNNVPALQICLNRNPNLKNAKDSRGVPYISIAAGRGYREIVETLIAAGADVNARDGKSWNTCSYAIVAGHREIARLLLQNKADQPVNLFDACIHENHVSAVKICLELNPTLKNAANSEGTPYIFIAADCGYREIVEALIAAGADVNAVDDNTGCTPLTAAAGNGNLEIVRLLLNSKADVNAMRENDGYDTPLTAAVRNGHSEIVDLLIQYKADVNKPHEKIDEESGQTPIVVAAANGHTDVLRLLLANGASINNDNIGNRYVWYPIPTPLLRAAENCHTQTVQFLIESGADIYREKPENEDVEDEYYVATCDDGQSPLVAAASDGHIQVAQLLLDADAQNYGPENAASFLNLAASYGETPLIAAAKNGHLKMVEFLVGRGADINKTIEIYEDEDRERILKSKMARFTPLHAAAANGHAEVVAYLLSKGARANTRTQTGYSPLHAACESNSHAVIRLLLGAIEGFDWLEFNDLFNGTNETTERMLQNALWDKLNDQLFDAIQKNDYEAFKKIKAAIGDVYFYEAPQPDAETKAHAENAPLIPTLNTPLHAAINKYREIVNNARQDDSQVRAAKAACANIIRELGQANYRLWHVSNAAGETPISMIEKNKRLAHLRDLIPDYNKEVRSTLVKEGDLDDNVIGHIVGDYAAPTLGETLTMRPEQIQRPIESSSSQTLTKILDEQASTSSSSSSTTIPLKRKEMHTPNTPEDSTTPAAKKQKQGDE